MSVETFHFCADRERVIRWWQMPIRELLLEMEEFQETDDSYLASFLVPDLMGLAIFSPLEKLRERNGDVLSPQELLRQTLNNIACEQSRPILYRLLSAFHPSERAAWSAIVAQVRELLGLYRGLHEVAHVGPHSEQIDVRGYNLLVERLQGVLPQEEAELYFGGTDLHTLGELYQFQKRSDKTCKLNWRIEEVEKWLESHD